jgi:hypothetical protein
LKAHTNGVISDLHQIFPQFFVICGE